MCMLCSSTGIFSIPTTNNAVTMNRKDYGATQGKVMTICRSGSSIYTTSSGYAYGYLRKQRELPKCKVKSCAKSVHIEPGFGVFEYCSPKCRDNDLLKSYAVKLKADIARLSHGTR